MSPEIRYRIECAKDKTPSSGFFLWVMITGTALAYLMGGHNG